MCIIVETAPTKSSVPAIDGLALGGEVNVAMVLCLYPCLFQLHFIFISDNISENGCDVVPIF
jgi:hypothetical protein